MRNLREEEQDQGEKPGERLWSWLAGSATAASPGNVTETQTLGLIPNWLIWGPSSPIYDFSWSLGKTFI